MNTEIWLDKKVNDNSIRSKYNRDYYPINEWHPDRIGLYYPDTTEFKLDPLTPKEAREDYGKYQVSIPPNTNRYHANLLFKQLVNYSEDNGFSILRSVDKYDFYDFCKKYST